MPTRHPAQKIKWVPPKNRSSNITRIGWDKNGNMYVQFRGGSGRYMYSGVSRQRAVAMLYAKSAGTYLNKKVKPYFAAVKIA